MEVKGKNVLVVGFARSGLAAANFLLSRGAEVTITDCRTQEELGDSIAQLVKHARLSLGAHRREDILGSDFVILSPGVPSNLPGLSEASKRSIPIYSEVELAYRFLEGRVVGVTGSNGKTTTTILLSKLFETAGWDCVVAGNVGVPLTQCLKRSAGSDAAGPTYVVELSSFQLENIEQFRCDVAMVLNISPDHQDRYPDFNDYLKAKERIFLNQSGDDYAVLNADDPHTFAMGINRPAKALFYSRKQALKEGVFLHDQRIRIALKDVEYDLMSIGDIRLRGSHNLENILAATATGLIFGIDREVMMETFRAFVGVEHRLETVRNLEGITFYNDSKATNVGSTIQALKAFSEPMIVIMGGLDKGADFSVLEPLMKEKVRQLILLGTTGDKIKNALGKSVPTVQVHDMCQAVEFAYEHALFGDVVVLSPGCTSFDMFEDFEHRGRVFKDAVNGLTKRSHATGK